MTRDELIKAIYDSNGMRQCPGVYCELVRNCMKCAEKQLAEYEAKVRAEAIEEFFKAYEDECIEFYLNPSDCMREAAKNSRSRRMSDIFQRFIDRDKVIEAYPTMMINEIMSEFNYQTNQYIEKHLMELNIDKDVLIQQSKEISRLRGIAEAAYQQGRADAIVEFVENLVGEIEAYASAGHSLDVIRWARNYAEQLKEQKEWKQSGLKKFV